METRVTVQNVKVGDRVSANFKGAHPDGAVIGEVIRNDEKCCIVRQDNGLTATIFGTDEPANHVHVFAGVQVKKI